jgi:dephospho-CoA kinase
LDVPLLFETRGDKRCDATVVVSAPHFIQRSRVLKRAGMTNEKFVSILNRQMSDREKRRRADFIISTGQDKRVMLQSVRKIVQILGSNRKKFKTRLWYKQVQ